MKHNTAAVAKLSPDYLGFIFYDKSPRNFEGPLPPLDDSIQKVGVFVNASTAEIQEKIAAYQLDVLQLHGDESPEFCAQFKGALEVWKVFSVSEDLDFSVLQSYESVVDKFLFDTHTAQRGGSGKKFNWNLFQSYPSQKPFILSGGIGPNDAVAVLEQAQLSNRLAIVDVNSRFEITPGTKDIQQLNLFKEALQGAASQTKKEL